MTAPTKMTCNGEEKKFQINHACDLNKCTHFDSFRFYFLTFKFVFAFPLVEMLVRTQYKISFSQIQLFHLRNGIVTIILFFAFLIDKRLNTFRSLSCFGFRFLIFAFTETRILVFFFSTFIYFGDFDPIPYFLLKSPTRTPRSISMVNNNNNPTWAFLSSENFPNARETSIGLSGA